MNQTQYHDSGTGDSQCDRILQRLLETRGQEVAMPELARIGAGQEHGFCMVHSRIADLRARGWNIPKARVEKRDRQMHSFYRLLIAAPVAECSLNCQPN